MRWLALGIAAFATGCSRPAGPQLHVLDPAINLGTINTENSYNTRIRIANKGDASLKILSVETSCGCARPAFPKVLSPGQSGVIQVDYKPDLLMAGARNERITIRSSDPNNRLVTVSLKAEIQPPLRIDPPLPLSVGFTPGTAKKFTIRVSPRDNAMAPLTGVEANDPRVSVKLGTDKRASTVEVTFGGAKTAGNYQIGLRLKTNISSVPIVEAQIFGKASSGPIASPALLQVHDVKAARTGTRLGTLTVTRGKVLSVTSDDQALTFKIEPDKKGEKTWVQVLYNGGWKPGRRSAIIRIRTDDAKLPIIATPLVVGVSE